MKLFHISEEPDIKIFYPRPSPQNYDSINGDVVFAISDAMLHNYLLPRDCPRVTYYKGPETSERDGTNFFGDSEADYIINVEQDWKERIEKAVLYKYEMPPENFILLDKTAGYWISYKEVIPLSVIKLRNLQIEISKRNAELRFSDNLQQIADNVKDSSLNFSIIRLRNAKL
ncbi:MAG: hypothetical protein JST55_12915 [Bacteroidetes bacterium]|nr:hypothetical protein [Bacteroidota bacterium]